MRYLLLALALGLSFSKPTPPPSPTPPPTFPPSAPTNPPSAPTNPPSSPTNPPSAPTNPPSAPTNPPSAPTVPPTPPPTEPPTAPAPTMSPPFIKGDNVGHLSLNTFVPYPGSAVGVNATGYVLLSQTMDSLTIYYHLMGVDETCTDRDMGDPNSCGLHIHQGFSCNSDREVMNHYWNSGPAQVNPDPWKNGPSYYMYDAATKMARGEVTIKYGFGIDEAKGHSFVIHDRKGNRIACGVLPATTDKVTLGEFAPYPMYEGPFKDIKGCVNMEFRGVSLYAKYNLTGVDPRCESPSSDILNSCGLHIHEGMTCSNGSAISGHYFDPTYLPSETSGDPWATANYTYRPADMLAMGFVNVEFGYGFDTSRGRAFVLHDWNGTRIACAQIPMYAEREVAALPMLERYPGYEGPAVTGSIKVDFRGGAVKILYNLSGTEPECFGGPGEMPNSCGIHIHSGFSCAMAGPHYFNAAMYKTDPWLAATYKTQMSESSLIVGYGHSFEDTMGRTVVIHSYNGTRVACANIPALSTAAVTATNFMPVPPSPNGLGEFMTSSTVRLEWRGSNVRMWYHLVGVEPKCQQPGDDVSCGIHIHANYNCTDPGDFFWNPAVEDPWGNVKYMADAEGNATGYVDVDYGYGFAETRGRTTVVIHNYAGDEVWCAYMPWTSDLTENAGLTKLVPIAPNMLTGSIQLASTGLGVKLSYNLQNVDPMCAMAGPKPLSCGLHIHKGFSCADAESMGGHFFNNATADPWSYVEYVASGTEAYGSVVVSYGESWAMTEGRVVVAHDYNGAKAACAVIPQLTDQVMTSEFKMVASGGVMPGTMMLDFRSDSVLMTYHLEGTDPACAAGPDPAVPLSCGLHIHNGTSCEPTEIGVHYYDASQFPMDPWMMVTYKADATGVASGMVNVEYGYGYATTKGRTVVVHNRAGAKLLCATIPETMPENAQKTVEVPLMGKYPEYVGPYTVALATPMTVSFHGVGARIAYNLTGVPCECSSPGPAPNSCGLHIHAGTTCMDASQVLGHWYNMTLIPNDPWLSTTYTSAPCSANCLDKMGATAVGALTVDFGYDADKTLDKVMVIHDYYGNRIACTPLEEGHHPIPRDLDMMGNLAVGAFPKYPGSQTALAVTGEAQLHFSGPEVTIWYRLMGADPQCTAGGRLPEVPNSCGIHIHKGFGCGNPQEVGGHYYNTTKDPWQDSYYIVEGGKAEGMVTVVYGFTVDLTKGRTFVLHDVKGNPITCSVLASTTDKLNLGAILPLHDYEGTRMKGTEGCVTFEFRGGSVELKFNLSKVDDRCTAPKDNTPNSCGIHIHAGMSCDNGTAAGGHLYDPHIPVDEDPWKFVTYKANELGKTEGTMIVENGYGFDMSQGHAFVLHDYDGLKATCNIIPTSSERVKTPLPPLQPYPGYTGSLKIEGSVSMDFRGRGVKIDYNLMGIEPMCSSPGTAPNSCGIHIHEGFTCSDATKVGAHYFNSTLYPTDPWATAAYTTTPMPNSIIVSYGFDFDQSKGRALVIHDYSGARIACALIPQTTERATAMGFVKVGTTPNQVTGMATLDFRARNVHINFHLNSVDPACTAPMEGVKNSCGIHIHAGTTCSDAFSISGHYYNMDLVPMDPWANITYKADAGAFATGSVDVEFGHNFLETRGRTLVLHAHDGTMMACAMISDDNAPKDTVGIVNFMSLESTNMLQGKAVVTQEGLGVRIDYNLMGVETNCSSPGPNKLSCGIHIHSGFNCSEPGGHYYDMTEYPTDPWMYATYTALANTAKGSIVVSHGQDWAHTQGRSLVLHNYNGAKVACQTLPALTQNVDVTNWMKLPAGSELPKVTGYAFLAFRPESVRMDLRLEGVDQRCTAPGAKPLSCGIHIHEGTCTMPSGHFYNKQMFPATDPWMNVTFTADGQGKAIGILNVEHGYGYEMSKDKIVIIHDYDGNKVWCANIGPAALMNPVTSPAEMKKYPAYNGIYNPSIEATTRYSNEGFTITYNLSGVPCECWQIGTAPNSCGLHIHEGASCSTNSAVGGHWFNNRTLNGVDPWSYTPYTARKCSEVCGGDIMGTTASGSLTVMYGQEYTTTVQRVLVIHDYMGVRIGCAPLYAPHSPAVALKDPFPVLPVVLGGSGALLLAILAIFYCRHRRMVRGKVGALNEKLAPNTTAPNPTGQNPTRRTLSVNHM